MGVRLAWSKLTFCSTSALPPSPLLTDYTGSEENIDISVLGLQSKLNFPVKTPPSHNHKAEAYSCRPGYNYSEQIHVDGAYLGDEVCVCVLVSVCVSAWLPLLPIASSSGFSPSRCCCILLSERHLLLVLVTHVM